LVSHFASLTALSEMLPYVEAARTIVSSLREAFPLTIFQAGNHRLSATLSAVIGGWSCRLFWE
jgi:hypothetical protein